MEFHGGIETYSDGRQTFNAYIARGYSYWFGDDLDLWITSNPFVEGEMHLNGISKKPWKEFDTDTARKIIASAEQLRCAEEPGPTRTPR
jgi:hypothetical protein